MGVFPKQCMCATYSMHVISRGPPGLRLRTWSQRSRYLPICYRFRQLSSHRIPPINPHLPNFFTNILNHDTSPRTHSWCPFVTPTITIIICSPSSDISATQISKLDLKYIEMSELLSDTWGLLKRKLESKCCHHRRGQRRGPVKYMSIWIECYLSPVPRKDPSVHVHKDNCEGPQDLWSRHHRAHNLGHPPWHVAFNQLSLNWFNLTLASTPMYAWTVRVDTQFLHVEEEANPPIREKPSHWNLKTPGLWQ